MMTTIEIAEIPEKTSNGTPIVHVSVSGTLTGDRYAFLEDGLRKLIAKHGTIRVLLVLEELDGMTPDAMHEDKRFESRHIAEIERVAIASATPADTLVPSSSVPFTDVNTRFFPLGETDQALTWLKGDE